MPKLLRTKPGYNMLMFQLAKGAINRLQPQEQNGKGNINGLFLNKHRSCFCLSYKDENFPECYKLRLDKDYGITLG